MWKKIIISLIVVAVLVGGFFFIKNKKSAEQTSANVKLVNIIEAKRENLATRVSADGYIRAEEEKEIKANLDGIVEEVFVDSADMVEEDDKIYIIDDQSLIDSLETARLNMEEAEGDYQDLLEEYQNQDQLNNLKLKEVQKNLEIAILSYQKEKDSLENQREKQEDTVEEAKDTFTDVEEKYEKDKYLYEKGAITENELKESRDAYQQARRKYQRAQNDLKVMVEQTIPNSLELAQLEVGNARNQLNYTEASIEAEKITENDLKRSELNIKKAERKIEDLNSKLDKIACRAPMTGSIINLDIKEGDKIAEGTTAGKMADLENFIVEAEVDEIDVNEVETGQQVEITSDSFDQNVTGKVSFIAPAAEQSGNINKYRTEIKIDDDKRMLRSGMFVNCEIISDSRDNVITVPSLAIMGEDEKYVFIARDGKAEKRVVETGLKTLSKIEIIGVEPGEKIIVGPFTVLKNLKEGIPVANAAEKVEG